MRIPFTFALLTAFALAGCSGGGSGVPSNPNPGSGGSTPSSVDAAQSGTLSVTDPIEQGSLESDILNGSMSSTSGHLRVSMASGACNNGVERTVTVVSANQTNYDVKFFYDAACTELGREVQSNVVTSGAGETITRNATNYNLSGTVLTTRATTYAITGTPASGNFTQSLVSALTIGTSGNPAAQVERTDTFATTTPGSGTVTGSSGRVANPAGFASSYGHNAALSGVTWSVDGSGNVTFSGARNGELFKGPFLGLTLATAAPFTVSGGSEIGGSTINGSVVFDVNGNLTSVSLTGTFLHGDTLNVTSSGSPLAINGTIATSGGTTVATFTVDQFGDGVITYANGSQGLIYDWHVVR